MPYHPSFSQLVQRYGEITAWHYLAEIERAANLRPQRNISDPEIRLANALRVQDAVKDSLTTLRKAA